jgi:hypothetical protein
MPLQEGKEGCSRFEGICGIFWTRVSFAERLHCQAVDERGREKTSLLNFSESSKYHCFQQDQGAHCWARSVYEWGKMRAHMKENMRAHWKHLDSVVKSNKRSLTAQWSSLIDLCQEVFNASFTSCLLLKLNIWNNHNHSHLLQLDLPSTDPHSRPKRFIYGHDCCADKKQTTMNMRKINYTLRKQAVGSTE